MRPELLKDKPLSESKKQKLNEVAIFLNEWRDIADVENRFNCTNRTARDMVSTLGKRIPIAAVSSIKGYKWLKHGEGIEEAMHTRNELLSRNRENQMRIDVLNEYILKYQKERVNE